jgi:hypothetical protein
MHGVHEVRQMNMHMAEPLVLEPSLIKVEIAIGKLKGYKSPGTDEILAKLIEAGGETLCSEIHKLVLYGMRNCNSSGRNLLLYQFIKRVIKLTVIIIMESPSYQLPTEFYATFFWSG